MKSATPTPAFRRPRMQFSLLGLMVLMLAMSLFGAPLYYFLRGREGQPHMHLVGMIGLLAGPMLLTIAASIVVAVAQWLGRR